MSAHFHYIQCTRINPITYCTILYNRVHYNTHTYNLHVHVYPQTVKCNKIKVYEIMNHLHISTTLSLKYVYCNYNYKSRTGPYYNHCTIDTHISHTHAHTHTHTKEFI